MNAALWVVADSDTSHPSLSSCPWSVVGGTVGWPWYWPDDATNAKVVGMNIDDFSIGMQLTRVDLDILLAREKISDKLRMRLSDLKNKYLPGDEVLHYCSDRQAWDAGMGSEGYILVRNSELVDGLVLRMN